MFSLFKRFRWKDWLLIVLIIALTFVQVFSMMMMADANRDLVNSIMFIDMHNTPNKMALPLYDFFTNSCSSNWSTFLNGLQGNGFTPEEIAIGTNVATANVGNIWANTGILAGYASLVMGIQIIIAVIASWISAKWATDLRSDFVRKVSYYGLDDIKKASTASLVTRSTNDINTIQITFLLTMRMAFVAPVVAIWASIKIWQDASQLTWVTAGAILFLVVGLMTIISIVLPKFKKGQKILDELNGIMQENLKGIRVIHAYNAEQYQQDKFDKTNNEYIRLNMFANRVLNLMQPIITLIMNAVILATYWVGASLINSGATNYGSVSSFMILSTQVVTSFMGLVFMLFLWPRANISANRINDVIGKDISITDPETPKCPERQGIIEFKDVCFRYKDSDEDVIKNISFKATAGSSIAIIGSTGCGKSTLINLVSRLYDSTGGEILLDGVNVKDFTQKELRSRIGFVPQKALLFSGTIKDNILFGLEEGKGEENLEIAAKVACADEFIENMPKKYESEVAQGGTNYSGGQRQRLCIARAVALDPEFYIFDDSFSALDFKTDLKVRRNIKENNKLATKIIVAQRVGTIMDSDLILVMEKGEVVAQGKHDYLLRNCDVYREIALSQLSEEELGL